MIIRTNLHAGQSVAFDPQQLNQLLQTAQTVSSQVDPAQLAGMAQQFGLQVDPQQLGAVVQMAGGVTGPQQFLSMVGQ